MPTTISNARRTQLRVLVINAISGIVVVTGVPVRAPGTRIGLACALALAAGVAGCAGGGHSTAPTAEQGKGGATAATPLAADEQGMTKAAKDVAEMFEKQRAAESGRRGSAADRATAAPQSAAGVTPTVDARPVTVRETAGMAGAGLNEGASTGAIRPGLTETSAATADENRPARVEANRPMSLNGNGIGSTGGRTTEAAQIVRTRLLTEHTRELAVLLEQEAMAPVTGKIAARRAGEGGVGTAGTIGNVVGSGLSGGTLVSSAMVLAALAPIDPTAAERFSTLRARLDEDQLHIADTVRRIVEVARNGEPKPAEGTATESRTLDGKAQPANSLAASKASVVTAISGGSVLSQVVLDAAISLDEQRGLRIGTLALTSAVESFGRYTPIDTSRFVAGRKSPILVYTELANFSNNAGDAGLDDNAEGKFAVILIQSIELRSETDGTVALDYGAQEFSSRARAARRDLFLTRRIELPTNLSIGTYVLNVRVKDRTTGSETESKLKLEIGAR